MWGCLLIGIGLAVHAAPAVSADLAIVIDDVGYNWQRGHRAINLPGAITIAVLPFAPHTQALVRDANRLGKDVIIHQPMEPQPSPRVKTETGTLTLGMQADEFDQVLKRSFAAVHQPSGLSNHTGSLLTQHTLPMVRVMTELAQRGLYFLDSRTTAATVALDIARQMGVPAVRRDVFLDHHRTADAIHAAFDQALRIARYQGHAVLIAHPYPISLDYLEHRLPDLPEDIRLVHAATLATKMTRQDRISDPVAARVTTDPATPGRPEHLGYLHISPGR